MKAPPSDTDQAPAPATTSPTPPSPTSSSCQAGVPDTPVSDSESEDFATVSPSNASAESSDEDIPSRVARALRHKDSGNSHFKSGDFTRAVRDYRRGTVAVKGIAISDNDEIRSLLLSLQTNMSMACLKQDRPAQSREVASAALKIDPGNVKALYRRAAAHRRLGNLDEAAADLKAALDRDAENREVRRELVAVKRAMEVNKNKQKKMYGAAFDGLYDDKEAEAAKIKEEKRKKKEEEKEVLKKRKLRWEDACVERMSKDEEAITYDDWDKLEKEKEKKEEEEKEAKKRQQMEAIRKEREEARRLAQPNDSGENSDGDEEEIVAEMKKQGHVRGYKTTSDGRKTSYFTREQTEEERKLIGCIAPKRIESPSSGTATQSSAPRLSEHAGRSAWNQAQTWEEKNTSGWCKDALCSRLVEAVGSEESGQFIAMVSSVKKVEGDASFATASGKKKYIFDFTADVKFRVLDGDREEVQESKTEEKNRKEKVVAKGHLKLPDICSTVDDGDYEVQINWKKGPPDDNYAVKIAVQELVSSVKECIMKFVLDFNAQY